MKLQYVVFNNGVAFDLTYDIASLLNYNKYYVN